jgi:hypothetical protein
VSRIFGEIRQNGYVVRDVEAAMRHWIEVLGVGPWFYFERAPITEYRYRGVPSAAVVSIALANSGPLQLELIQPRDEKPSSYRDFLRAGREGLQHVAYWTERFDVDAARAERLGYRVLQSGCAGGPDGRFVYYETEGHPGTIVELSEVSGPKGAFFAHIREAARGWDGSQPIRRLGR